MAAALAGGGVALHIAPNVWLSRNLGAVPFSSHARTEILDGAERIPPPFCSFETHSRGTGTCRDLRQLRVAERH